MEASVRLVEWGVASRGASADDACGDSWLVRLGSADALIVALDALGHGAEAAASAARARQIVEEEAGVPLPEMLRRCHERLRGTRGVTMSLARFQEAGSTLTWLGVGDVQGLLLRADPAARPRHSTLLLRGGIVGRHLPPLGVESLAISPGDQLVFATDGIESDFVADLAREGSPQEKAEYMLRRHHRGNDDGLVLVMSFLGVTR